MAKRKKTPVKKKAAVAPSEDVLKKLADMPAEYLYMAYGIAIGIEAAG